MKWFLGCATAALLGLTPASALRAAWSEDPTATARYIAAFQNPDGGFAGKPGDRSSLAATSSAVRTLKNVGGSIPDVLACLKYLKSCYDADSGGVGPPPRGPPGGRGAPRPLVGAGPMEIRSPGAGRPASR